MKCFNLVDIKNVRVGDETEEWLESIEGDGSGEEEGRG